MRSFISALALLAAGLVSAAKAEIVPAPDLIALTADSEVIVVGRVEGATFTGPLRATQLFRIAVDRRIKGVLGPVRRVSVRLDVSDPAHAGVADREYAIFFLRRSGNALIAADPFHPALVASPNRAASFNAIGDTLAAVTAELTNVLATEAGWLLDPESGVGDLALAPPARQAEIVYFEASEALSSLPYTAAGLTLENLAVSGPGAARLWALSAFLDMVPRDRSAVAAKLLEKAAPDLMTPAGDRALAVQVLAGAIRSSLRAPEAVPTLAALLRSEAVSVRRAAASALGAIGTAEVIRPLADLALNDADQEVRYFGVLGLSAATQTHDAPAMRAFATGEAALLQRWKSHAAAFR